MFARSRESMILPCVNSRECRRSARRATQIGEDSAEKQWTPLEKGSRIERGIAVSTNCDVDHMNRIDADFSVVLAKGREASPPRESTEGSNR